MCSIYRAYGAAGELLYLGKSCDPVKRIRSHARRSEWWPEAETLLIQGEMKCYPEASMAELAAIAEERPRYNRRRPSATCANGHALSALGRNRQGQCVACRRERIKPSPSASPR